MRGVSGIRRTTPSIRLASCQSWLGSRLMWCGSFSVTAPTNRLGNKDTITTTAPYCSTHVRVFSSYSHTTTAHVLELRLNEHPDSLSYGSSTARISNLASFVADCSHHTPHLTLSHQRLAVVCFITLTHSALHLSCCTPLGSSVSYTPCVLRPCTKASSSLLLVNNHLHRAALVGSAFLHDYVSLHDRQHSTTHSIHSFLLIRISIYTISQQTNTRPTTHRQTTTLVPSLPSIPCWLSLRPLLPMGRPAAGSRSSRSSHISRSLRSSLPYERHSLHSPTSRRLLSLHPSPRPAQQFHIVSCRPSRLLTSLFLSTVAATVTPFMYDNDTTTRPPTTPSMGRMVRSRTRRHSSSRWW